eukprot:9782555-Ditylum_brightwellii.AAC.1
MDAIFSHQPKCHQAKYGLEKEEVKNDLEKLQAFLMVVTQQMKLMAPALLSSRTSVTLSVLKTRRKPVIEIACLKYHVGTGDLDLVLVM